MITQFPITALKYTTRRKTALSKLQLQLIMVVTVKFSLKTKSGFQVGVRIAVPPYPFDDEKTFNNYSKDSVIIFKEGYNREGVHIEDVRLLNDEWLVAGSAGVVLVVCGCGPTMKQAQQQAYNRITNIMIPNMYYRKDIGDRWFEDSDKLHSWGYLHEI